MHRSQFNRRNLGRARGSHRSSVTAVPRRTAQSLGRLRPLSFAIIAAVLLGLIAAPGAGRAQADDTSLVPIEAGGLQGMLERVPALLPELRSPETATISYANLAAQLDAVGIAAPSSVDDAIFSHWNSAIQGLYLPEITVHTRLLRDDFGFDLLQADETLEISAPPFRLTFFRGRFDQPGILAALSRLGYAPVATGSPVLALRPDFEQDPRSRTRYAYSAMNVATVLADGTLVFAPARSIVEAVLAVQAGQADSLAARADVAALLPHVPPDLASGAIVAGQQLATGNGASTNAGTMPPVALALIGTTVGGPLPLANPREGTPTPIRSGAPTSRGALILLMRTAEDAAAAVPVVEARLTTGASLASGKNLSEYFSGWAVRAVPGAPLLLIDLAPAAGVRTPILYQMLHQHDLVFVAW